MAGSLPRLVNVACTGTVLPAVAFAGTSSCAATSACGGAGTWVTALAVLLAVLLSVEVVLTFEVTVNAPCTAAV